MLGLMGALAALGLLAPAARATGVFVLRDPTMTPTSIARGSHGVMWVSADSPISSSSLTAHYAVARVDLAGHWKRFRTTAGTSGIAVTAGGTVFATERLDNRVAIVSPAGKVTEVDAPGEDPGPSEIAAGPDGNGWFVERGDRVARITPGGQITEFALSANATPQAIVAGRDGRLWVGIRNGIASITTDGAVTEHHFSLPTPSFPADLAAAPDGTFWMSENEQSRLLHIDADGNATAVPGTGGEQLTVAPGGTLSAFDPSDPLRVLIARDGSRRTETLRGDGETITAGGFHGATSGPAGTTWLVAELTGPGGGVAGGLAVLNDGGRCIVPDLRRSATLAGAKHDLRSHGCRVGKVRRRSPHHLPTAALHVAGQSVKPGRTRPGGSRIGFTLAE
jgi:virginiamycin B lyase